MRFRLSAEHAYAQIRNWPRMEAAAANPRTRGASGSFVIAGAGAGLAVYPATRVVSALPHSDLLLLAAVLPPGTVHALPVSPYPARAGAAVRAHFVAHEKPSVPGWDMWVGDTWGRWEAGKVLGYRDFAGRETEVSCM